MQTEPKSGAELVETAIAIAAEAHRGQLDKAGAPYILHPLRLALSFTDPIHQAVAALHDVLEDTELTAADLEARGIPADVIASVETLSRREGESYGEFIDRIATEPVARVVKCADLRDNLRVERLDTIDDAAKVRINRYLAALRELS